MQLKKIVDLMSGRRKMTTMMHTIVTAIAKDTQNKRY